MQNDNIGQVSNAHVAFADASDTGARSSECVRLAALHSIAVDFCKTGVPAELPRELTARSYPHFMEYRTKPSYESRKILGQIYTVAADDMDTTSHGGNESRTNGNGFDERLLISGYQLYVGQAWNVLQEYTMGLYDIACKYQVWTDVELVSETRRHGKSGDGMRIAVHALQHVYKDEFWREFGVTSAEAARQNERVDPFPEKVLATDVSDQAPPYLSFARLAVQPMCQLRTRIYGSVML